MFRMWDISALETAWDQLWWVQGLGIVFNCCELSFWKAPGIWNIVWILNAWLIQLQIWWVTCCCCWYVRAVTWLRNSRTWSIFGWAYSRYLCVRFSSSNSRVDPKVWNSAVFWAGLVRRSWTIDRHVAYCCFLRLVLQQPSILGLLENHLIGTKLAIERPQSCFSLLHCARCIFIVFRQLGIPLPSGSMKKLLSAVLVIPDFFLACRGKKSLVEHGGRKVVSIMSPVSGLMMK